MVGVGVGVGVSVVEGSGDGVTVGDTDVVGASSYAAKLSTYTLVGCESRETYDQKPTPPGWVSLVSDESEPVICQAGCGVPPTHALAERETSLSPTAWNSIISSCRARTTNGRSAWYSVDWLAAEPFTRVTLRVAAPAGLTRTEAR